ncbi:hypothetical protein NL676_023470 [Syzygium grande]|nr:hypothetical protein NL676_023470 [Syzygium grande]
MAAAAAASEKQVMVVAVDESDCGAHALGWTIDHFFPPAVPGSPFKLVLVHARPSAAAAVGLVGPGAAEVFPIVEADLKKSAARVVEKAKELCASKSVHDVMIDVVEGDARIVLCDAVERHHASILVVGSHGHGAIKRAVLGSVSDYCAHHAHCTVMIVKKPKAKH